MSKTITLRTILWKVIEPRAGKKECMLLVVNSLPSLGNNDKFKVKTVVIPGGDPEEYGGRFKAGDSIVVVAKYEERDGKLPLFESTEVFTDDGREAITELKDWY